MMINASEVDDALLGVFKIEQVFISRNNGVQVLGY
jgi:hypothetical protein